MVSEKERHFRERQRRRAAEILKTTELDKIRRRQKAERNKKAGKQLRVKFRARLF